MPFVHDCEIAAHQEVAEDHYRLVLRAPEIAANSTAGQFCMLQVQEGLYPFLRRPMCFERIYADSVSVLYRVEGEGTRLMAKLSQGQSISVQGPLGKPWPIRDDAKRHILVAGGIGIAPFPALAEAIIRRHGHTPEVIIAARSERYLLCDEVLRRMGCTVHLATDDGSAGRKAFASQVLADLKPGPDCQVYACGPMPMLRATHDVCSAMNAPCLVSLEAEMACGDGVCLGCVVEANVEIDAERMVRVCYDGPVFDSSIIAWDAVR